MMVLPLAMPPWGFALYMLGFAVVVIALLAWTRRHRQRRVQQQQAWAQARRWRPAGWVEGAPVPVAVEPFDVGRDRGSTGVASGRFDGLSVTVGIYGYTVVSQASEMDFRHEHPWVSTACPQWPTTVLRSRDRFAHPSAGGVRDRFVSQGDDGVFVEQLISPAVAGVLLREFTGLTVFIGGGRLAVMTSRHMADVSVGLAKVVDGGVRRLGGGGERTGGHDDAGEFLDSLAHRLALLVDATDPALWPQGKPRITGDGPAPA